MRVLNVHSRELPAPAERAWELVASLASEHDELWPSERWPTSPIEFDRRLGPGAKGGHGAVRYDVERFEPGRRVVFRFGHSSGLDGVHALEVQPLTGQRSRLTHTLDTRVRWKLMPLYPVLLAGHDAFIEDLLDNAERAAGGCPGDPQPLPRWLRVANAAEAGLIRLRRDALGWLVPGTLAALAALHADTTFSRLDLALYSPLCLALGAGAARLLLRAPAAVMPRIGSAVSS